MFDLGEAREVVRVVLQARERHGHAVADVGADRERLDGLAAGEHVSDVVGEDEHLAVGIDGAGTRQLQPQAVERHDVEVAHGGARRTDAVRPARPGRRSRARWAASPVSPSQGAPEWPFGENGGRLPMCGRSSGNEMRPFLGSNWMTGLATVSPGSVLKTSPGYAVG